MKKLFAYFERLVAQGFFGTPMLSFQNGKLCKIEWRLKPEDL